MGVSFDAPVGVAQERARPRRTAPHRDPALHRRVDWQRALVPSAMSRHNEPGGQDQYGQGPHETGCPPPGSGCVGLADTTAVGRLDHLKREPLRQRQWSVKLSTSAPASPRKDLFGNCGSTGTLAVLASARMGRRHGALPIAIVVSLSRHVVVATGLVPSVRRGDTPSPLAPASDFRAHGRSCRRRPWRPCFPR
jgi:hypothetical protein